jgi:CHAD domain-containing protein
MTLLEKRIKNLSDGIGLSLAKLAKDVSSKSVHRLRTTIRKAESLVDYARPDLGRKQEKAIKALAGLRRRAGKVRDLDVQMDLLGAIGNGSTAHDRKVLSEIMKEKRARQAERLKSLLERIQGTKILSHLDRVAEKIATSSASLEGPETPLDRAQAQLSALAAGFTRHENSKPSLLHQVRIRMKMIRYLAALGEDCAEQQGFLEELKAVQDALGAWHDWEELAKTVEKYFGDRVNCPLLLETRALLAARYAAANGAVAALFAKHAIPVVVAQKQPQPELSLHAMAKRA